MAALLERYFPNVVAIQDEFVTATIQTLYMVFLDLFDCGHLRYLVRDRLGSNSTEWDFRKSTAL